MADGADASITANEKHTLHSVPTFGLGRKFTRQSGDFKFFSVISPNAGSAVQDTAVPVHCFQLIRK